MLSRRREEAGRRGWVQPPADGETNGHKSVVVESGGAVNDLLAGHNPLPPPPFLARRRQLSRRGGGGWRSNERSPRRSVGRAVGRRAKKLLHEEVRRVKRRWDGRGGEGGAECVQSSGDEGIFKA